MSDKKIRVEQFDDRLARAYTRTHDKQAQYDEWASTYDQDLVGDMDYSAHIDAGNIFADLVPDTAIRVLDVACGTGLAGQHLRELGYTKIDGVDFSAEMLAIAESREIYNKTWQHDFTLPADIPQRYDALLCVGLFSFAIPKISDMHNVVNCVVPGGRCVITVNGAAWEQLDLEPEVHKEAKAHNFSIDESRKADYIRAQGIDARVLIITR
ncbi:MAG: methyltransferase domain-containing protein [Pseudomonadota bacterium]